MPRAVLAAARARRHAAGRGRAGRGDGRLRPQVQMPRPVKPRSTSARAARDGRRGTPCCLFAIAKLVSSPRDSTSDPGADRDAPARPAHGRRRGARARAEHPGRTEARGARRQARRGARRRCRGAAALVPRCAPEQRIRRRGRCGRVPRVAACEGACSRAPRALGVPTQSADSGGGSSGRLACPANAPCFSHPSATSFCSAASFAAFGCSGERRPEPDARQPCCRTRGRAVPRALAPRAQPQARGLAARRRPAARQRHGGGALLALAAGARLPAAPRGVRAQRAARGERGG
jgi:hypothetical protein